MRPVSGLWLMIVLVSVSLPVFAQDREISPKAVERIRKEVRHELVMLPYLDVFDNLSYNVEGYNVSLFGQVTNPTVKSDAEKAVKKIEGVEKVDNQIEVLPVSLWMTGYGGGFSGPSTDIRHCRSTLCPPSNPFASL